jgi:DNA (cytosine-5)-methyltransferase 1
MNYLSVCSGVEAATVAWHDIRWKPIGFSEIEKFPSQVLAHHYPSVTNYGDMTKYKEWNINEPINLLVGGTPCQSFSVAGLRKGLQDPRGNLALVYLGIADHFKPKWIVWENVPGVLSSNGGRDFGSFLGALAELGYGFAYRVLDAQNFGVPQRRRRVFVVGCLGDWRSAAAVLFERESMSRYSEKGGKEREEIAKCLTTRIRNDYETESFITVFENHGSDCRIKEVDVCPTITRRYGTGGNNVPIAIQGNLIGRDAGGPNGVGVSEENTMYTLTKSDVHGIAYGFTQCDAARDIGIEVSPTLSSGGSGGYPNHSVSNDMRVRRLTPIECERLQGFPDNYTNIFEKTPDSHRYKAMGNSMAVPVMRWIGNRINEVENG